MVKTLVALVAFLFILTGAAMAEEADLPDQDQVDLYTTNLQQEESDDAVARQIVEDGVLFYYYDGAFMTPYGRSMLYRYSGGTISGKIITKAAAPTL